MKGVLVIKQRDMFIHLDNYQETSTDMNLKKVQEARNDSIDQPLPVVQGLGELSKVNIRVLDYLTSFITENDPKGKTYLGSFKDYRIIYSQASSGKRYNDFFRSCQKLTQPVLNIIDAHDRLAKVPFLKDYQRLLAGQVRFRLHPQIAYVWKHSNLATGTIRFSDLRKLRSKYTMIAIRLLLANDKVPYYHRSHISASLRKWENWFLGVDKYWTAGRFKQKALNVALKEIEALVPLKELRLIPQYKGRKVIGYDVIADSSVYRIIGQEYS